ncbi:MAG: hypothetical protein EAZ15_08485 [Sphingobacteriales bacterium]|nr:MAG: hypothetical protein EAZ15_08485 [Sphingobacteriales bacterium]
MKRKAHRPFWGPRTCSEKPDPFSGNALISCEPRAIEQRASGFGQGPKSQPPAALTNQTRSPLLEARQPAALTNQIRSSPPEAHQPKAKKTKQEARCSKPDSPKQKKNVKK